MTAIPGDVVLYHDGLAKVTDVPEFDNILRVMPYGAKRASWISQKEIIWNLSQDGPPPHE